MEAQKKIRRIQMEAWVKAHQTRLKEVRQAFTEAWKRCLPMRKVDSFFDSFFAEHSVQSEGVQSERYAEFRISLISKMGVKCFDDLLLDSALTEDVLKNVAETPVLKAKMIKYLEELNLNPQQIWVLYLKEYVDTPESEWPIPDGYKSRIAPEFI